MADRTSPRAIGALASLNFFMADVQAGVGPFLGVFLQAHGWKSGAIGTVMTLGGIAGVAVTAPAGALVDATTRKRALVVVTGVATVVASAFVLFSQRFWVVALSQVATAIAGAAIVPAVAGITLGIAKQRGFNRQNGRNQAFNHAGNVAGAALSGWIGARHGLAAVFVLAAFFGVATIASALAIPRRAIDDQAARGLEANEAHTPDVPRGVSILFSCKPLLALALLCFHLGNAAMLPLFGLAAVDDSQGNPASIVAITIVVAQATMVVASLVAMRVADTRGYWGVLFASFLALPIRGVLAASLHARWGVYPVQILDGVGAGLQSVAVPGLVARILASTGRVNVGQGAVMTAQGIGAAASPALGGWIAQLFGYRACFLTLGALALPSIVLWVAFSPTLRVACAGRAGEENARVARPNA